MTIGQTTSALAGSKMLNLEECIKIVEDRFMYTVATVVVFMRKQFGNILVDELS